MLSLGAYPLLAIFKLLGHDFKDAQFITHLENQIDTITRVTLTYPHAMATALVAINAKAEGDLVISGTKGTFMCPLLGGRLSITKCDMKISIGMQSISTNLREKGFVTKSSSL